MKKIIYIIIITLVFQTNIFAASFNCHFKVWKNGYFEKDVFATSYVEINTWLKKITFLGLLYYIVLIFFHDPLVKKHYDLQKI